MKRIKSAVIDAVTVKDLNLTLRKDEFADVPDNIFYASKDLQRCIRQKQIICVVEKTRDFIPFQSSPDSLETRVNVLERAVSGLLKKDYAIPTLKYEDNLLHSSAFLSSEYDAMIVELFVDELKRDPATPGNAVIRNGSLEPERINEISFYNSIVYKINQPIEYFMPIASYEGDEYIEIAVTIGGVKYIALQKGPEPIDNLGTNIVVEPNDELSIQILLKNSYNPLKLKSFSILMKLS